MKLFLKPKEGLIVMDPDRKDTLPPKGREVESSVYWWRRLRDGDVDLSDKRKEEEGN